MAFKEVIVSDIVSALMKEFFVPKVAAFLKGHHGKVDAAKFNADVDNYLTRKLSKYEVIDTLAFPNRQTSLERLYEPLTVVGCATGSEPGSIRIDGFPEPFLPQCRRIVVQETAGTGKTTLAKILFRSAVLEKAGLPMLIELRKISSEHPLLSEIQQQLSPMGGGIDQNALLRLIIEGGFIFLMDGYDEVSTTDRAFVQQDLKQFIEKAAANQFLITARREDTLVSFGDFQLFRIKELTPEEAFSLIRRYDAYNHEAIAADLIDRVTGKEMYADFLKNPLTVSLLYKCYAYRRSLPLKPSLFYQQVFDALFNEHDFSKGYAVLRERKSGLYQDDFDRMLRLIAYYTAMDNEVEYDKNSIVATIERAKKRLGLESLAAGDFLSDLVEAVPLFLRDGPYFLWIHKSLQDYFAARFLWIGAGEAKGKILRRMYDAPDGLRFANIVKILADLDFRILERTMLLWLLREFRDHITSVYKHDYGVSTRSLGRRVEATFRQPDSIVLFTSNQPAVLMRWKGSSCSTMEFSGRTFLLTGRMLHLDPEVDDLKFSAIVHFQEDPGYSTPLSDIVLELTNGLMAVDRSVLQRREALFEALETDVEYVIDDDPGNPLNRPEIFDDVTNLLRARPFILGSAAMLRLIDIERALSEDPEDDLLNWATPPSS